MFTLILLFVLLVVYLYFTRNHNYWKERNVKHDKPIPIFGNMYRNIMGKQSITQMATELYEKYPDEKVVGFYRGTTPELLIRDVNLIRKIINTDFAYFYPRGIGRNPKIEPVFMNLFHVDGDAWRLLRQRLTSAFTTAKLKRMFPLVVQCAEKLQHVGDDIVNRGGECDVRELMACFTTEFIGACGFGLQFDTINNENSLFRRYGKIIFDRNRTWTNIALIALYDFLPTFRTIWQKIFAESLYLDMTAGIVRSVRTERNSKPSNRHDFIDLLLELESKGTMRGESIENKSENGSAIQVEMEMDFNCMAAQVFIFYAAGFETSSSATSYTLHQLAFCQEEQKKIQDEIDQVLAKYHNKMSYDSISEMTRLRMAFKEGLRMFPSLGTLHRVCAQKYTIPELGITIDPGVKIIIPLQAIQNDEKYFKNPSEFRPERFLDISNTQNKYSYLPFGEGPRMCIGARLGEMQSLAGLAALLSKFTIEPSSSTKRKLEVSPINNIIQSIKGGLPVKLKLRNKDI